MEEVDMQWFFDEYQKRIGIGISSGALLELLAELHMYIPEVCDNKDRLKEEFIDTIEKLKDEIKPIEEMGFSVCGKV